MADKIKKKPYYVDGTITISVEVEIEEAESEEDAMKQANELLDNMYTLNVIGAYHNKDTDVKRDLEVNEYAEEEE